jgi:hypothetical protein
MRKSFYSILSIYCVANVLYGVLLLHATCTMTRSGTPRSRLFVFTSNDMHGWHSSCFASCRDQIGPFPLSVFCSCMVSGPGSPQRLEGGRLIGYAR